MSAQGVRVGNGSTQNAVRLLQESVEGGSRKRSRVLRLHWTVADDLLIAHWSPEFPERKTTKNHLE
jgi:hypothetical protein